MPEHTQKLIDENFSLMGSIRLDGSKESSGVRNEKGGFEGIV